MIPLKKYLESLMAYAQKNMKFSHPPKWELDNSEDEGVFRKTAHYNPGNETITIFTLNRHPKDILRSFSHELVHHSQNCRGEFDGEIETNEGYAQNNKHLREMEEEAYLIGNLCFRDWEDSNKMVSTLENKIREVVRSFLLEKTKTDSPDRAPSDTPSGRLKPLAEEEVTEEETIEEEESVEEETTLTEWKNKNINKLLMEKWCK